MAAKNKPEDLSVSDNKSADMKFTKEQLLKSERYSNRRDLVDALLENNKTYTFSEADKALTRFLNGNIEERTGV